MVVQLKGNTIPPSKGRGGPKVHMACGVSGDAPGGFLSFPGRDGIISVFKGTINKS